jgi:two-component system sensor histidine kinase QseC
MRTPLAILRLHAQNAQNASNEAERQEALGFLIGGVDRLSRVVNQLLTMARIEPMLSQRQWTPVDLASVVTDTMAELTPWILRQGMEPALEISPGDYHINSDAGAIGIALQNLVTNAVNFSPPRGLIRVTLQPRDGQLELMVEDQGPGIDEAKIERAFQRFVSEGHQNGAGLGLSIVAMIMERLGGNVRLQNQPGGGLQARLRLPRND